MKTVQMTLDEELVKEVDHIASRLHTTRSAFTRDALRLAVTRYHQTLLEEKHKEGYAAKPVAKDEFSVWESEQAWGDE